MGNSDPVIARISNGMETKRNGTDLAYHLLQRKNPVAEKANGLFAEAATVGADVVSL